MNKLVKYSIIGTLCIVGIAITIIRTLGIEDNQKKVIKLIEITSSDLQLGDLKIGMNYDEILKIMKNRSKKTGEEGDSSIKSIDFADGTNITIQAGRAQVIFVSNPAYPTTRGLIVGDNKEKVLKLYGKPEDAEYGDSLWNYSVKNSNANFAINFKKNKVAGLEISVQEI